MKMSGEPSCYYLRSEDEMRALFPDHPDAIDNTWRIAEMCDMKLEFGVVRLPRAGVPPEETADQHLARLCGEGLARRYSDASREPRDRLDYELNVVRQTGFADYILVVHDFAREARERGILMAVRGSAAASIILYVLGVTDIDPLEHRLVFERFLNVERREMPVRAVPHDQQVPADGEATEPLAGDVEEPDRPRSQQHDPEVGVEKIEEHLRLLDDRVLAARVEEPTPVTDRPLEEVLTTRCVRQDTIEVDDHDRRRRDRVRPPRPIGRDVHHSSSDVLT